MRDAVIVEAVRTPVGKGKPNGALAHVHPVELLAHTLRTLVERSGIDPALVDDVIGGAVDQVGEQAIAAPGIRLTRAVSSYSASSGGKREHGLRGGERRRREIAQIGHDGQAVTILAESRENSEARYRCLLEILFTPPQVCGTRDTLRATIEETPAG